MTSQNDRIPPLLQRNFHLFALMALHLHQGPPGVAAAKPMQLFDKHHQLLPGHMGPVFLQPPAQQPRRQAIEHQPGGNGDVEMRVLVFDDDAHGLTPRRCARCPPGRTPLPPGCPPSRSAPDPESCPGQCPSTRRFR